MMGKLMMGKLKIGLGLSFALLMGLVWISCDSGPTGPSETIAEGNRLSGRFTNLGSAGSAFQGFAQSALEGITVYVKEDPAIQTQVVPMDLLYCEGFQTANSPWFSETTWVSCSSTECCPIRSSP